MRLLVTGGAGFIGSAVVRQAIADGHEVVNLDALTYAANLANLDARRREQPLRFEQADIRDRAALDRIFATHQPDAVMHLAAESHVDRSIDGPGGLRRHQRHRHLHAARGGARLLGRRRATSASTTSRPTRSSARSGADRPLHRDDALRAELALFRLQGRERPPGPRLGRDLRPAGRAHQLLEQLRPLPLPREADPGRDPERARRPRDPGLRPAARTCATGSTSRTTPARSSPSRRRAASARATTSAATPRRATSTSSARICALMDEMHPDGRAARPPDRASSPTAPATTSATRSTPPRSAPSSAGSPR